MGDDFHLGRSSSKRRDSHITRPSHSPWRGAPHHEQHSRSISPEYKTTNLHKASRSPSPKQSPPKLLDYYGTTQLERRSRSPSPGSAHSVPLQRLSRPPFRPPLIRGRRLPPVPTVDTAAAAHSPSRTPLDLYPCDYEGRSRSPSPCSVYSLSSHYRRSRLRRLPTVIAPPPPVTPFVLPPMPHSTMQSSYEAIRLPTLSHSPTIPHPDTNSPNTNFNFPHLCTSPTHCTPTQATSQNTGLYA